MANNKRKIIGMTEAGDAGWDLSWYDTIINGEQYAGAILITKAVCNKGFQQKAIDIIKHKPVIIHAGCTGWGGTSMESGARTPIETLNGIRQLIDNGFPATNMVLRIDPVIPTTEGLERAASVVKLAGEIIPDVKRIRISIYDDYAHSHKMMASRGYETIDDIRRPKSEKERRPTLEHVRAVAETMLKYANPDQIFELCAEPELEAAYPERFRWSGCLSHVDCDIMGIEVPSNVGINGQNRYGCRCLRMKKELLRNKRRCPNDCAYCYWSKGPAVSAPCCNQVVTK